MKRIYIYHKGHEVVYFSTLKKMHRHLLYKLLPVHKVFSTFKQWIELDFIYNIGKEENDEYCTISKVW